MSETADPEAPYGRKKDGTPYKWSPEQRANWRASVRASNNKPASGIPAMGAYAGGPAKGRGAGPEAFIRGSPCREQTLRKIADKEEAAEHLFGVIYDIAMDPEQSAGARIQAALGGMNRVWGAPEQKTKISGTVTLEALILASMGAGQDAIEGEARVIEQDG